MTYAKLARFYDEIHAELTEDVDFSVALARSAAGPVLELGCGTGRLLWPMAQAGINVTGLDNSADMLALAHERRQLLGLQQRVVLESADMTRFSLSQTDFALVLLSYNTALHLSTNQVMATLHRSAAHMQPGGALCIDVINPFLLADSPDQTMPEVERTFIDPYTGATVTQATTNYTDLAQQTVTVNWLFDVAYPDGTLEKVESAETYHYYYPHEWLPMLQHAGFSLESMWGDYDDSPFAEDTPRLLLIARKLV